MVIDRIPLGSFGHTESSHKPHPECPLNWLVMV